MNVMACDINVIIDRICKSTTRPDTLNALHACRPGHPWNKDNLYCWRNASSLVAQDRNCIFGIGARDRDWLERQSRKEAEACA